MIGVATLREQPAEALAPSSSGNESGSRALPRRNVDEELVDCGDDANLRLAAALVVSILATSEKDVFR
jgi:hypothetical protein